MVTRSRLDINPWERIRQMAEDTATTELTSETAMKIMQEVGQIISREPDMPASAKAAIELLCVVINFQTKTIISKDTENREAQMRLETMATRLKESMAIRRELEMEVEESTIDPVSKLLNQQAFRKYAEEFFKFHREKGKPLNFLLADIDFFKSVNDTFGHDGGDAVLRQMGELLARTLRISDFTFQKLRNGNGAEGAPQTVGARDGGEEFAIMLDDEKLAGLEGAKIAAERLRAAVEKHDFILPDGKTIKITISIGVAAVDFSKDKDFQSLRKRADSALYECKNKGRNMSTLSKFNESDDLAFEPIPVEGRREAHRYENPKPLGE